MRLLLCLVLLGCSQPERPITSINSNPPPPLEGYDVYAYPILGYKGDVMLLLVAGNPMAER